MRAFDGAQHATSGCRFIIVIIIRIVERNRHRA
jgi:hypothetical protein